MKIAVAADGSNLDAKIAPRLGMCDWLLFVDTGTMNFEAVRANPGAPGRGAAAGIVALAIANGAEAILTGYVSPRFESAFREDGVEVVTGIAGTAREAAAGYARDRAGRAAAEVTGRQDFRSAISRSARQFGSVLPLLLGVILLIGLLKALVPEENIKAMFTGFETLDTLIGAALGSIFAGNPVSSYIIGDALLSAGVGLSAVAALILTWTSVGLVQMPAEIAALGARFAVARCVVALIVSVAAALLAGLILGAVA